MLTTDGFCSVKRSRISLNCWRNCSTRWPAGAGRLGGGCLRRVRPRQGRGRAGKLRLELVALPGAGLKLVLKLAEVEFRRLEPAVDDVLVAQFLGIGPAELRHLGLRVAQPLLIVGDLGIDEPPRPLDIAPAVADILLDEDLEQRLDDGMGQFRIGILELDIEDLAALAGEPDALFQPGQQRFARTLAVDRQVQVGQPDQLLHIGAGNQRAPHDLDLLLDVGADRHALHQRVQQALGIDIDPRAGSVDVGHPGHDEPPGQTDQPDDADHPPAPRPKLGRVVADQLFHVQRQIVHAVRPG